MTDSNKLLQKDITYLRESQDEIKQDVKEINVKLSQHFERINKDISELYGGLKTAKWLLGILFSVLAFVVSVLALNR